MTRALLLVDLQQDFLDEPQLEPPAGELVEATTKLLRDFRAAADPVLHVRTLIADEDPMPHWIARGETRCRVGTAGAAPPTPLAEIDGELVCPKRFHSAFDHTGLADKLHELDATEVVLAGVHAHACIHATALDAYRAGFRVTIAGDAVGSYAPIAAAESRRWLDGRVATFATVGREERVPRRISTPERVAAAVASARRTPGDDRAVRDALAAASRRIAEPAAATRLAESVTAAVGKPIRHARAEVRRAGLLLGIAAELSVPAPEATSEAEVRRRPLGTVALITPHNNPVGIPAGKAGPALALGNAVVWKPAPRAEGPASELLELLRDCGLPEPAMGIVTGDWRTGEALLADPVVAAASVTGSNRTGFAAQGICAARRIPLQGEFGGNNGAIVWRDTDLPSAAKRIAAAAFGCAGQRCTANRRVIVDEGVAEELIDLLAEAARNLPIGEASDPRTEIGPLIDRGAADRVRGQIARARQDGHRVIEPVALPQALAEPNRFIAPAIVRCEDPSAEIVRSESFGPVCIVQPASGFDHALELLDAVSEGLVAALFTGDEDLRGRFLDQARAGVLKLDHATADVGVETPFGGWKASGVGPPEHGAGNIAFYTRQQAVYR